MKLKARVPDSSKHFASVVVIGAGDRVAIRMRTLAKAKSAELIARVAHVNHMTSIPKVCWDPSDGEVYVEWTLFSSDGNIAPVIFEKVIAHILEVFHAERLHFRVVEMKELVDRGVLDGDAVESMLRTMADKFKTDYVPLIHSVLKE